MIARASRGWRPYLLLSLLCLGLYLPGLASLPVTDRDEARFAQATRQMLETGDLIRIRFQDEARNKKPAGIYWLQAASVALFSDAESADIWPYRLPSMLGASLAVLLTFALGRHLVGAPAALLGAALLASSLTLVSEAHLAKTDAALLACVVAAQLALGEIYRRHRANAVAGWPWALLFWLALAGGSLIKGPVAPLLALLTALALIIADREWRWMRGLRPLWGMALFVLLLSPWLIAITKATGGAFISDSLTHDFAAKLFGAQEGHGAPPGAYLMLLAFAFWPGSLFLPAGFLRAWQERELPSQRFLLAWILPFWAALELVPTKLPHYLLPVYPALALLAAHALFNGLKRPLWLDGVTALLWAIAGLALAAVLVIAPVHFGHGLSAAAIVVAAIIVIAGGTLLHRFRREAAPGLAARAAILALLTFPPVMAYVAPTLDRLWLSRGAAALVRQYPPPPGVPIIAIGYNEPSLVFLLGTATKLLPASEAAGALTAAPGAEALVESRADDEFRGALARIGWTPQLLGRVAGIDYSNGRRMVLTLYAASR